MNFTGEIRKELLRAAPARRCCRLAFLRGILDTDGRRENGFSFTVEHEEVAEYLLSSVEALFGVRMTLTEAVRDPKHGRDKLTFGCFGPRAREYLAEIDAESADDDCAVAYLKGAFLGGGSCTLPRAGKKTGYHLEIDFSEAGSAEELLAILDKFQLIGSLLSRGERSVVYFKSREAISDFLSVLGAEGALGKLENVTSQREENNNRNRVENCTAGNADRSAIASAEQVLALAAMRDRGMLAALSEPLRETAVRRLENPAMSLAELAETLGVTKSGLQHRLKKLMHIYETAEERNGETRI